MYLRRKLEELQAFIEMTSGISQSARLTLGEYFIKWGEDLRIELGLSFQAGGSIGVSFDPSIALIQLPKTVEVRNGLYISKDGKIKVEVIGQDPLTGMVQMEMSSTDAPEGRLEAMSSELFILFFKLAELIHE
jgi:hypothetical protein